MYMYIYISSSPRILGVIIVGWLNAAKSLSKRISDDEAKQLTRDVLIQV
jgi:hypothetical protein